LGVLCVGVLGFLAVRGVICEGETHPGPGSASGVRRQTGTRPVWPIA
jgi:hypothetical protein